MLQGYWFGLLCILTTLLLITGWGTVIHQYVKLYLLIPLLIAVWADISLVESIELTLNQAPLTIHISTAVAILLLLLNEVISQSHMSFTSLILYVFIFAMTMTMVKIVMLLFPELDIYFTDVHLALCLFIIGWLLQINVKQVIFVTSFAFVLAEIMLVWQQQGNYIGVVGSLSWWDQVSINLMVIISLLLVIEQLSKYVNKLRERWLSRMKS